MAAEEGDQGVSDTSVLSDVRPYLFKEGGGISIEGFVESKARVASLSSDDSSRHSCRFQT